MFKGRFPGLIAPASLKRQHPPDRMHVHASFPGLIAPASLKRMKDRREPRPAMAVFRG